MRAGCQQAKIIGERDIWPVFVAMKETKAAAMFTCDRK
jgi:hypothetical protein